MRDDVCDGRLELVLFCSGEGDLDEDYLALEFWVALEEAFECDNFVSHALERRRDEGDACSCEYRGSERRRVCFSVMVGGRFTH